ncbi:MAG: aminotransferase class I/II-fold pyridoxal phosphate-dependent enzyme [Clostridiales bacterium]|nr:aminotransferase class I/II-fold pyridoxal phosphate-dependent enzyme [Clostridiales bacterium]
MSKELAISTKLIHGKREIENPFGSLQMPIFQTSTFKFDNTAQGAARFSGEECGYIYSRIGNPSTTLVEERLAILENTETATVFASGMGAISSATTSFLKKGSRLIADKTIYSCSFDLFSKMLTEFGVKVEFVDFTDLKQVRRALRRKADMVYFETMANPTMKLVDIEKICTIVHEKYPDCLCVVDNTFATGLSCKPCDLGADIVVHSATKYLNGHGDIIAGVVCTSTELMTQIKGMGLKALTGSVLAPMDAFLLNRGLKTLPLRLEKHSENAMKVAAWLETRDGVEEVYYVGLKSHPQYRIAKKQLAYTGGMIAFELENPQIAERMMNNVKLCILAVSLGDCETLIEHPGSMTHSNFSEEEMIEAGFSKNLVRLSVGLEDADDIIADLDQALEAALKA